MVANKPYEIGSHFDLDYDLLGDFTYTFSGRAAIELGLKDILAYKDIKKVYMPSYCCLSMVQPFMDRNIEIIYYQVLYDPSKGIIYKIDTSMDCDIFFSMSYFGLEDYNIHKEVIDSFSKRGVTVIEDITHSLFSKSQYLDDVDYSIASVRKWLSIPSGGFILKHKGSLFEKPSIISDEIVKEKIQAMKEKHDYLEGKDVTKDSFLMKLSQTDSIYSEIDSTYKIDSLSLRLINSTDIESMKFKRKNNAKTLYQGLKNFDFINLLIPNPDFDKACPLFVPIMVKDGMRDDLRKFLISKKVYCPVHWPNDMDKASDIPREQLSLICDQRYNENDMKYIIDLIGEWQSCKER